MCIVKLILMYSGVKKCLYMPNGIYIFTIV